MGQVLCCCFRSYTPRSSEDYGYPNGREVSELSDESSSSAPIPSCQCHGSSSRQRRSRSIEQPSQNYLSIVNVNASCNPKLKCIIISSFGKDLPSNVVPKKVSSDFLRGVGDDLTIIQDLIGKDDQKELGNVEILFHFKQEKLATITRVIGDRMKDLKLRSLDND